MKKFRVISDLHMDVNKDYPLTVEKDDIFTVVAGDTCGSPYIIDVKASSDINFNVESPQKLIDYIGKKNGRFTFKYSAELNSWFYKDKAVIFNDAGLITKPYCETMDVEDGCTVTFKVKDVEDIIRKSISSGILIAGNHIVYNKEHLPIEEIKENLHKKFPETDSITFLDLSIGLMTKEIDGILFIGSTLYTDYKFLSERDRNYYSNYSEKKIVDMNMHLATPRMSGGGLNDFYWGRTNECTYPSANVNIYGDETTYYLSPKNYLNFFNRTFKEIERIVKENKDKDIVIVTHHCPSPRCISEEYVDSAINSSYISDLEWFIKENANIKCWVCGHVHHRDSFKIGDCLIVMNPLGYCRDGQFKNSDGDKHWSFNTFVDTKNWEVHTEDFDISKWSKKYDKHCKERMKYLKRFGNFFI